MEWQAVVLVVQILLLAVGYFLFQQARAELTAHAASTPVLAEAKALQRGVKGLINELQQATDQASDRLERRCSEARDLIAELERRQRSFDLPATSALVELTAPEPSMSRVEREAVEAKRAAELLMAVVEIAPPDPRDTRRRRVYDLADEGASPLTIARETGLSEGEVETLLGLRVQRR